MGRRGGRKQWSRKRKSEERDAKSGNERKDHGPNGYTPIKGSCPRMEAYYSLIGLHDEQYDEESKKFVPCKDDDEKHAERNLFMSTLGGILPASFRVDRSLDPVVQNKLLEELKELVGREMELEVELPRTSRAFGGIKNILEKGNDGENNDGDEKEGNGKDDGTDKPTDGDNGDSNEAGIQGDGKDNGNSNVNGNERINNNYGPIVVKKTIPPAKPIPFITSSDSKTVLGYQLSVDRRTIRRNKSLEPLFHWLKLHSDAGHVTRQETVSMIPPVVLDVREGMSVLDMCAAPGSKTCQLLEVVGGLSADAVGNLREDNVEPRGYVVANDADSKRAYMLVNQLRRMNSPSVFVTSCDGQYFPILDENSAKGTDREGTFDRVLADVPCSGDGTIRKNPGIWKRWNQLGSLALHPLQLSIALRGARLTKVGGCMVYSTCSMNPMENEAVVAELLRIADGSLVLEDPRDRMEGLVARPGWSSWRVLREGSNKSGKKRKDWKRKNSEKMKQKRKEWEEKRTRGECGPPEERAEGNNKEKEEEEEEKFAPSPFDTLPYVPPATWDYDALSERTTSLGFFEYESYDDVEPEWSRRIRSSCFPPTEVEAKSLELHKCLRCLPQDMDTGGFFVALLKKVKPLSKNAAERMYALARESRGGVGVESHLSKGDVEGEKKGVNVEDKSDDVAMTESSAAEDKNNTESSDVCKSKDGKPNEENKEESEEPTRKAPTGKVGTYHNNQKKGNPDLGKQDFIPTDSSIWPPIIKEYGLGPTFPKEQFMCRASGEAKVLYFITKSIKEEMIDCNIQDRVTTINSGLKAFERCSLKDHDRVAYRVAQEGIQFVVPHMTKRILTADMDDFYTCMKDGFVSFEKFGESFRKQLEAMESGSCIVLLKGYEDDMSKKMFLSMWRRPRAVTCFVAKMEREAILSKMGALGYVAKMEEDVDNSAPEKVTGIVNDDAGVA